MEIPAGYGQANLVFGGTALPLGAQTTFGFEVGVGFTGDPVDAGDAIVQAYKSSVFYQNLAQGADLLGCLVKFGPTATGPSGFYSEVVNSSATGGAAVPNVAFLIRKGTGQGGRAGRGRCYVPGVPEENVLDGGGLNGATVLQITADWANFMGKVVLEDLNPVLLHGVGSPLTSPTLITSWECDSTVATQRRRLRR